MKSLEVKQPFPELKLIGIFTLNLQWPQSKTLQSTLNNIFLFPEDI